MTLTLSLSDINWISVLVTTAFAFMLGALWYSKYLFGNLWQKLLNPNDEFKKDVNMPVIFGSAFVLNFLSVLFLDLFIGSNSNLFRGGFIGLIISIMFVATSLGTNALFSLKPFKLFLIDAGYYVALFTIGGAILGAW
jgi:hypothetical protein